jgi:hypothetical protein
MAVRQRREIGGRVGGFELPSRWTPAQWAVRAVMVGGLLLGCFSTALLGEWPMWWFAVVMIGLSLGYATAPEHAFGTVGILLAACWWGIAFRGDPSPVALVGAAGLLASHLAGVVAAYGPGRMALDRATVLLWTWRGALLFLLAVAALVTALLVSDQPEPFGIWFVGAVLVALATGGLAAVMARGQDPEG